MTFKEQLKNDIDPLVLSEEFKNALLEKMANDKKPKLNLNAAKICLSAAAICLLGFGAFEIANLGADLFPSSSSESAANYLPLTGAASDETGYESASYFANDSAESDGSVEDENYGKSAELPEAASVITDSYSAEFKIETECADAEPAYENDEAANYENEAEDSIDTSFAVVTDEAVSTDFSNPIYNGEIICTIQNTFCSDRPWYTAEEMANIIVTEGYKLARVKFGKTLTEEEKAEQDAINSGFGGTYYNAEVDGEEAVVYFFGSTETQELDNPIYGEGDEVYCALEEMGGVYLIREYPLGDIYSFDVGEIIYLRIQPCELNAPQLLSESIGVVTTTIGNPARYYSAYPLEEFIGAFSEIIENNY